MAKKGRFRPSLPENESVRVRVRAGGVREEHGLIWRKDHEITTATRPSRHVLNSKVTRGLCADPVEMILVSFLRKEIFGMSGPCFGYHLLSLTLYYREGQSRDPSKGRSYQINTRDVRPPPKQYVPTQRGSAYESGHGTIFPLISRTKSANAGVTSQPTSRMINSADQSQRPLQAQKPQLSSLAQSFASLGLNEYSESSRFISDNPSIVAKSEIDALMANASFAEKAGQSKIAQACIHQAVLLKACKDASSNGISSFFRDLIARDGRAKDALMKDVQKVYGSIQEQVMRTGQQSLGPDSEPRGRKLQTTERTVSQNPYAPTPRPLEPTQKPQLSSLAQSFASLGLGEYLKSLHFISDNPNIIAKSEIDALIANASFLISNASSAEKAEQSAMARTCIHQAVLLKACKDASSNGISSFFQDLTATDGRAEETLMKDVQKVYESIQEQGRHTGQQSLGPDSEPRDRKLPVVLQTTERTVSQNPYARTPRPPETTKSQTPVIRDRERRPFYTDNQGNVLRPASSRHDPDCQRPVSEPAEITEKMASVSIRKEPQSGTGLVEDRGDGRNAPGRAFRRTSVSGPPEPLPPLPEYGRLEYTKIEGTAGNVEKLDHRESLLVLHIGRYFMMGR